MLTTLLILNVTAIWFWVIVIYKKYKRANDLGFSLDEYELFLIVKGIILKEYFKKRENEISDRQVYEKVMEILELI